VSRELELGRKRGEAEARAKKQARQKRYRERKKATLAATLAKGDRRTNIVKRSKAKALSCAFSATQTATLFEVGGKRRFAWGIGNYHALVEAFRRRKDELGVTNSEIDELCGFSEGYTSHLLSPDRKHSRAIGLDSLPRLLSCLGLSIALVETPKAAAAAKTDVADVRASTARRKAREAQAA
jgi:hypothetical protein